MLGDQFLTWVNINLCFEPMILCKSSLNTGSSVVQVVKKKSKNAQQPPIPEQTTIQGGKQGNKNNKVQSFLAGGALINNRASPRHYRYNNLSKLEFRNIMLPKKQGTHSPMH